MVSTILIASDGHFSRKDTRQGKSLQGSVPPEALRQLNAAVLAAKLSTWKASYGSGGNCNDASARLFG
jgi:hypothetical protein